jgi:hypothetical protein
VSEEAEMRERRDPAVDGLDRELTEVVESMRGVRGKLPGWYDLLRDLGDRPGCGQDEEPAELNALLLTVESSARELARFARAGYTLLEGNPEEASRLYP